MSVDLVSGGGTAERTCQLAKALQGIPDTGAKVLSTTVGLNDQLRQNTDQYLLLPCLNDRWYIPAPYIFDVYKALKWADIVLFTGHWTFLNAMVYFVNKLLNRPYLFCPAGAYHLFGRSKIFKRLYNLVVGHSMVRGANRMIAIPKAEQEHFHSLGVEEERTVSIPNGVLAEDFENFDESGFRKRYDLDDKKFILFMGRLNVIKGPDILLEAFIKVIKSDPKLHLVYAGPDGGMKLSLQDKVQNCGLEKRVHFIGYVSGMEKSAAYHAAELLVVPSRLEAMSIVALESAICGTPVVMTDKCGFSELVVAGGAVEVRVNAEEIANVLTVLLPDEQLKKQMGMDGKKCICENYTWNIAAKKHHLLSQIVLSEEKKS
jgi:glycosyltransferase involved in cell wall biosynthesis